MRLLALSLLLTTATISLHAQLSAGQIDPTKCISDILKSTITLNSQRQSASKWLDLVDESYYKEHKTDVDAAASYAGWQASASFQQFDSERRKYHHDQEAQSSTFENIQYFFNGMTDEALKTVNICLDRVAGERPGVYYSIEKNTSTDVVIRMTWSKLPGSKPEPFLITTSSLSGGVRVGTNPSILSRYNPFQESKWEDEPHTNELFARSLKLEGSSTRFLLLRRENSNREITGSFSGPNFDEVYFDIPAPTAPQTPRTHCEVAAREKSRGAGALNLGFPPSSQLLMLDCNGLPVDKKFFVTWQGQLLPPQYPSYSSGQLVDTADAKVDYYVSMIVAVNDAAGQALASPVVAQGTRPAKEIRELSGSTQPIPVPSNGEVLVYLVVFDSNKWPAALGPISISNDFRITVDTTK